MQTEEGSMKKLWWSLVRVVFFFYIMFLGFLVTVIWNRPSRWFSSLLIWVADWPEGWRASQLD